MSQIIEQPKPRAEWLEDRKKAIGASDAAAILGVSPFASEWDVFMEKTGRLEPWSGNEQTRLGQFFEPGVLDYAESRLGALVRGERILHPSLPIASTLDGRVAENNRPVEAKTTGLSGPLYGDWGDVGTDEVPEYYLVQVHTQLLCTKADLGYLFALLPGRGVVQFEIERSDKICDHLENVIGEWWDKHIIGGVEPSRDKASLEIVKRMKRTAAKSIDLGGELASLVEDRQAFKAQMKVFEDAVASIDSRLLANLGDAEQATFPDGSGFTYLKQKRGAYSVEECEFRVLRIKKAKK
jgi:putative phage-type endonuclease